MNGHYDFHGQTAQPGFAGVPTVHVPLGVWQKLMGFIAACPTEINGFGYVDRLGDSNVFVIEDIFILNQVATAVGVEVSEETLHRHLYELTRDGGDAGRMRFQWHSHVNMAAYFSGTDLANIEGYAGDWMISLVGNKRSEYEIRLDVFRPFRFWGPVQLVVDMPLDAAMLEHCQGEIRSKVRTQGTWRKRPVQPSDASTIGIEGTNLEAGGEQ